MTEKAEGCLEILVHISAPSRGKDDTRYRALARAYQSFEPINRLSLCNYSGNGHFQASDENVGAQPGTIYLASSPEELRSDPKTNIVPDEGSFNLSPLQAELLSENYITNTDRDKNPPLDSPQASFSGVSDNLDSPALRRLRPSIKTPPPSTKQTLRHLVASNESSWETPPSVIPDSQSPCNRAIPEFSSPTRVLELYLQHFDTPEPSTVDADAYGSSQGNEVSSSLLLYSLQPQTGPAQTTPPVHSSVEEPLEVIRETPYAGRSERHDLSPSTKRRYPSSPNAAALSGAGHLPSLTGLHRNHVRRARSLDKIVDTPDRPATQTSPLQKRRKLEVPATRINPMHRKLSKPSPWPRITPDEIHPPPPRTSLKGFLPPLITPALQSLAVQLELPRRYHPRSQTRPLRELERGYWSVSMVGWSKTVRDQAWVALRNYLGQGKAGWGVWCLRCDSRRPLDQDDEEVSEGHQSNGSHKVEGDDELGLRMYCWGGVVGHTYLLLYLVSQRRVKGTGARWVDGGGEVVVVMP